VKTPNRRRVFETALQGFETLEGLNKPQTPNS